MFLTRYVDSVLLKHVFAEKMYIHTCNDIGVVCGVFAGFP